MPNYRQPPVGGRGSNQYQRRGVSVQSLTARRSAGTGILEPGQMQAAREDAARLAARPWTVDEPPSLYITDANGRIVDVWSVSENDPELGLDEPVVVTTSAPDNQPKFGIPDPSPEPDLDVAFTDDPIIEDDEDDEEPVPLVKKQPVPQKPKKRYPKGKGRGLFSGKGKGDRDSGGGVDGGGFRPFADLWEIFAKFIGRR